MDINSRNLGQQEEDLDKKKFRKRASMSRPNKDTLVLETYLLLFYLNFSEDGTETRTVDI